MENNDIPQQLAPTPLLPHVTWRFCEKSVQCGYMRKEVFYLVFDGDSPLRIGQSKNFEQGVVSGLRDRYKRRR